MSSMHAAVRSSMTGRRWMLRLRCLAGEWRRAVLAATRVDHGVHALFVASPPHDGHPAPLDAVAGSEFVDDRIRVWDTAWTANPGNETLPSRQVQT